MLELKIIKEVGFPEALEGMSYSFELECPLESIRSTDFSLAYNRALKLARLDGGHNKFLESIFVWVDIRATLKWWKQFDTYRVGITKLSKSTMHTLMKRPVLQSDFSRVLPKVFITHLNKAIENKNFSLATDLLPSCYLQTRRVCMNYKAIRGIIKQRKEHRLPDWGTFCVSMEEGLRHPELLGDV